MGRHHDTARTGPRPPDQHHSGTSPRRRATRLAVIACAVVALTACGGDDDEEAGTAALDAAAAVEQSGSAELAIGDTAGTEATAEASGGTVAAPAAGDPGGIEFGEIGRDVIIEMQVSMSSDDIPRAVAAISARASALGGGIASSNVDYGDPNAPQSASAFATLVVKVPPAGVQQLIGGLADTGTVRSITQSAQDVTDQLVDLDVRIANARQSVINVREFMDRTQNLAELVTLEAELTRRQTELEQLEAQQRNLSDRVAMSTITIGIVTSASVPETEPDRDGIGGAFADGWSAFVAVLYGVAIAVAVLAPFLVAGVLLAAVAWLVVRRRTRVARPESLADLHDVSEPDDVPTPTG